VHAGLAIAGEVALSGRLRVAGRAERRHAEARRLGFARLLTGRGSGGAGLDGIETATDIRDALRIALVEPG
jgi:predicted ATP-dependent serine protease